MKTLDMVDILALNVRIWTGRKKLKPEDLKLGDGGELPPEEVASLGSKRVMDPDRLNPFYKLKKQMERALEGVGIRFLGGYAIPRDKTAAVTQVLDKIVQEFLAEKAQFVTEYDKALAEWIHKHPTFADALERAVEPAASISAKLWADYSSYRIGPADSSGSLDREVERMGNTLLDEVAQEANETYEKSVAARPEKNVSKRILSPLRRIRGKLDGLAFLDGAIGPMVAALDELILKVPEEGKVIDGPLYHEIVSMILILSDPEKVRSYAVAHPAPSGMANLFGPAPTKAVETSEEDDDGTGTLPVAAAANEARKEDGASVPGEFSLFEGLFGQGGATATVADPPAEAPALQGATAPAPAAAGADEVAAEVEHAQPGPVIVTNGGDAVGDHAVTVLTAPEVPAAVQEVGQPHDDRVDVKVEGADIEGGQPEESDRGPVEELNDDDVDLEAAELDDLDDDVETSDGALPPPAPTNDQGQQSWYF